MTGLFLLLCSELGVNCVYRAGINAGTAVDAGISINGALVARFADGVHRTGFVAGATVDALFGNRMSQGLHLLLFVYL